MRESTEPIPTLSYRTQPDLPRSRFSWLVFLTSGIIVCLVAFLLAVFFTKIKPIFADFKLELPAPTKFVLRLSEWFTGWGWIVAAGIPPALGFLAPRLAPRRVGFDIADYARLVDRMIAAMIIMLSIMTLLVITIVLILLPFFAMVEGITAQTSPK
jgi:hypothetical protein